MSQGGTVTIEIRPGQDSYTGSTRNGVTTSGYGAWTSSYTIITGEPGGTPQITWSDSATVYRGQNGLHLSFVCPPNGDERRIWGSNPYTDDSSICTAAVHAGLISFASGGTVSIEIRPGLDAYPGSISNGVTSSMWGGWYGSYTFVTAR
jgi:hypothetical protein